MPRRKTTKEFIEDAIDIHGDKYDYSEVKYINNKTKVIIYCHKHGSFDVRPDMHIGRKNGCPKCGKEKMAEHYRKDVTDVINDFRKIHGDKYDYSKIEYKNNRSKIIIICPKHGEFKMKPNSHLSGQGCKKCYFKVNNLQEFIQESIKVHGNKYDYSISEYIKAHGDIKIICKKHGLFKMKACDHYTSKQGCPKCGKEKMAEHHRKDLDLLLKDFKNTHGDYYDYSEVRYKNNKTKVKIKCRDHGYFYQIPKSHINGDGCPKCSCSTGERKIISILEKINIEYKFQHRFADCLSENGVSLRFDFYLPEHNTCVEYDGKQHFEAIDFFGGEESFKRQQVNDSIKNQYCYDNNIKLIRIPYWTENINLSIFDC